MSRKKRPVDPDEKLLEDIIRMNKEIIADKEAPSEDKFRAQDRILKALGLKARKAKASGGKFDLGSDEDE